MHRLRVVWKLLAYLSVLVVGTAAFVTLLNLLAAPLWVVGRDDEIALFILGSILGALFANWFAMRFLEGERLADIGLAWGVPARRHLLIGLAGGVGTAWIVTLFPVLVGMAEFRQAPEPAATVQYFIFLSVVLLVGAAGEEIQVRGYLLQILARSIGIGAAAVLTGALFGLAHLGNVAASPSSVLNTILAGVALAFALWRSGDLWFPIGIHAGWNIMLVFAGANLSGYTLRMTRYELHWHAGPLWSGGAYGPEGGLLTTIAFLFWFLVIWKAPLIPQEPLLLRRNVTLPEPSRPSTAPPGYPRR
ncbi:MAG: type II CAAX prenyl endopeptidase Rce1 family protein [Bryobacteraceae bacterium]